MATVASLSVKLLGDTKDLEKSFGSSLKTATNWGAGIAAAAAVAAAGLVKGAMDAAAEINKYSQVTGTTTKNFQQWDKVLKATGYSMEDASGDFAMLAEKAVEASNGVGEGAELFGKLGVEVTGTGGKLKTQGKIFDETITALQGMKEGTDRNALASALLGTTGEELVPVLNMTNEELEKMKGGAAIVSEEDLASAAKFKKSWDKAKNTLSTLATTIGIKLMPMFQGLLDWVIGHMPEIKEFTQKAFDKISEVITIAIEKIKGIIEWFKKYKATIIPVIEGVAAVWVAKWIWMGAQSLLQAGKIAAAWVIAMGPISLVYVAIAGLAALIIATMPDIKETTATTFDKIKEVADKVWTFFKNNILPIFKSLYDYIQSKMPQIKDTVSTAFDKIKEVAKIVWTFFKNNILPILKDLHDWIKGKMPQIKDTVKIAFDKIVEVAKTAWTFFKNNMLPILKSLYDWIKGKMPTIKETVATVFNKITEVADKVWTFFKDNILPILGSLYDYIQSKMPQIKKIVETTFNAIKDVVDIVWDIFENFLLPILEELWEFIEPTFPLIGDIIKTAFDIVIGIVEGVIDVFETVTGAIETAVGWLTSWNDKDAKDKTMNMNTNYTNSGVGIIGGALSVPSAPSVPSFDVGTNMVKNDGLAMLHQGEAVVPKKYNPENGGTGGSNLEMRDIFSSEMKKLLEIIVNKPQQNSEQYAVINIGGHEASGIIRFFTEEQKREEVQNARARGES